MRNDELGPSNPVELDDLSLRVQTAIQQVKILRGLPLLESIQKWEIVN